MTTIAFGWLFVVAAFAVAYATAPGGTLLGALFALVLGTAPLVVLLYVVNIASRRRRAGDALRSASDPDRGGHAAGDAVAPVREEP